MMLDQTRIPVSAKIRETTDQPSPRRITRCPVCETAGTLRETEGMILCTHCFWALAVQTTN